MTQVQHRDDLPLCPTCERSDYLVRWDTARADWLCSGCQRMYWDDQMLDPATDGGATPGGRYRCEACDAPHGSTGRCDECGRRVREYLPMVGPAWLIEMPSGMADLLYPEDEFESAFQNATGVRTADAGDEHEEEWRISLIDWDGPMEVPVVHP